MDRTKRQHRCGNNNQADTGNVPLYSSPQATRRRAKCGLHLNLLPLGCSLIRVPFLASKSDGIVYRLELVSYIPAGAVLFTLQGLKSLCDNAVFERSCRARLQAGTVDSRTCSPKGERYRGRRGAVTQT